MKNAKEKRDFPFSWGKMRCICVNVGEEILVFLDSFTGLGFLDQSQMCSCAL